MPSRSSPDTPVPARPSRVRYFTPSEANALLQDLAPRALLAARGARRMQDLVDLLRSGEELPPRQRREAAVELHDLRGEVGDIIDEITEHGVEVKGLDPILLDFPGLLDGQEVYLCWREGESAIAWWHPLHGGFAGRRHIDDPSEGRWAWCH